MSVNAREDCLGMVMVWRHSVAPRPTSRFVDVSDSTIRSVLKLAETATWPYSSLLKSKAKPSPEAHRRSHAKSTGMTNGCQL